MKKISCFAVLYLFASILFAQIEKNKINIAAGPSLHGTGDMKGLMVSVMYEHQFIKRFSLANGITTTIHHRKYDSYGSAPENMNMNFTTAGIQFNSFGSYHLVSNRDTKLSAYAGALLRFQSTSLPSVYGYTQDPSVYPEPFYTVRYDENPNTISPGYGFGLSLKSRIAPKYFLGITAGFQNDTRGDAITAISLLFERVLSGH